MASKWVQQIKDRLKSNPLYWGPNNTTICKMCGGSGKKVPLHAVTNYGNEFNHCSKCGYKYT